MIMIIIMLESVSNCCGSRDAEQGRISIETFQSEDRLSPSNSSHTLSKASALEHAPCDEGHGGEEPKCSFSSVPFVQLNLMASVFSRVIGVIDNAVVGGAKSRAIKCNREAVSTCRSTSTSGARCAVQQSWQI